MGMILKANNAGFLTFLIVNIHGYTNTTLITSEYFKMNALVLIRETGLDGRTQHLPAAAARTPLSGPAAAAPAAGTAGAASHTAPYVGVRYRDASVPALPPTAAFAPAEVAVWGLEGMAG